MGKKKLKDIQQVDGKLDNLTPVELDEILGATNKMYKSTDIEKYKELLQEMNMADIQAHAVEVGLMPIDHRPTLVDRLLREFKKNTSSYKNFAAQNKDNLSDKQKKDILKIINQ